MLIRQKWLYLVKWLYSGNTCCTLAKLVVFVKICCVRVKVVEFGRVVVFGKMVLVLKSGSLRSKVDVFEQKRLHSGKSCCFLAKVVVFEIK